MAREADPDRLLAVKSAPTLGTLELGVVPQPQPQTAAPTVQAPQPLHFDAVVRHQLRQLGMAAALTAAFAPVAVGMCAAYNFALDEYVAHGMDPRYPTDEFEHVDAALPPRLCTQGALGTLATLGVVLQTLVLAYTHGVRPSRRALLIMAAASVPANVAAALPTTSDGEQTLTRAFVALWMLVHLAGLAAWVGRRSGSRRLARLALANGVGNTLLALSLFWLGAGWFLRAERDLWRLIVLALSTAVFVEPCMLAIRGVCYAAPPARARLPVLACAGLVAFTNLFQRWAISVMDTAAGTVGAVAVVGAVNALVWHSIARRDLWLASGTFLWGGPFDEATARSVSATIRCVAEIADMFACIAMALLVALFRVGPDKQAPAPAPILLSLVGQLFVCLGTDFAGALVALWLGPQSAVYRSYARGFELRVSALTGFRRRAALAIAFFLVVESAGLGLVALYDPANGDRALACAWSKSGAGWWHRVPCPIVEGWLSSSSSG